MKTDEAIELFEAPPRRGGLRRYLIAACALAAVLVIIAVAIVARDSSDALAQLRVRDGSPTFRHASSQFRPADEGENLGAGDVVRTDETGQAQIDLFDGSAARMDRDTQVTIETLSNTKSAHRIGLKLDTGRTWNRVEELTSSSDRFEVKMPGATASVKGTTFITDCRSHPTCFVVGVDGSTLVSADNGDKETLGHFECVQVASNGLTHCDARSLGLLDDWVRDNLAEDQELALATVSANPVTPTPTFSFTPSRGTTPHFRPRSVATPAPTARATPAPTPRATPDTTLPPTPKPKPPATCKPSGGPDGDVFCD